MRMRPRLLIALTVGVVVVALCVVAVHLRRVHDRAYEYRWSPSAAAPKVQYAGRNYLRGPQVPAVPTDALLIGRTEGRGRIYGPRRGRVVPTVVYVRDGERVFDYALSGGP
jgi:hypothetical protein